MQNIYKTVMLLVIFMLLVACSIDALAYEEKEILLSQVPANILAAVENAVPGINIQKAKIEETGSGLIYELAGPADGKRYEVEVSPDGEILEKEFENDPSQDEDDQEDSEDKDSNE